MVHYTKRRIAGFARVDRWDMLILALLVIAPLSVWVISGSLAWFVLTFGAFFVTGIIRYRVRIQRFRCPECKTLLDASEPGPDSPIEFTCERCHITWDSGATWTDGSDGSGTI